MRFFVDSRSGGVTSLEAVGNWGAAWGESWTLGRPGQGRRHRACRVVARGTEVIGCGWGDGGGQRYGRGNERLIRRVRWFPPFGRCWECLFGQIEEMLLISWNGDGRR